MTNGPTGDGFPQPGASPNQPADSTPRRRVVDPGRLLAGGLMAGIVAAGVALVGLLIARGIADVPVLVERNGELIDADAWWYAGAAFAGAVVATGLLFVLITWAPQPFRFFGWIVGLVTALAALVPFATEAELASKVATSLINLAIGLCIGSIVSGVGRSATRIVPEPPAR